LSVPNGAQRAPLLASRWKALAAFAAGAVLNLAFAPYGCWPLAIAMPAALFALIRGVPPRRAGWIGASFATGLFSIGTYWLYTCIHKFGQAPIWLTLFLQAALVAIMATYSALLCYLANRFWLKPSPTRHWLVLPALWVVLEWVRGWFLSGFPWLGLGYAFTDSPFAGYAPVLGVYSLTWAAVYAAVALDSLIRKSSTRRQRAIAAGALVLLFGVPAFLGRIEFTQASGSEIPVAIVQGAVPQDLKWQENNRDATLVKYSKLTAESAWGARLIVWPEAALPVLANDLGDYLDALRAAGRRHNADFAIGLVRYEPETDQYRNGLLVMSEAGGGWYYKRRLVPFGEFFPVPKFIRSWMRLMSLPYTDMSPGDENQPVLRAAGQPLGLTICYEDAYGSQQLRVLRDATLLVNVTNNAWYGDSTAPHQHFQISRMRAREAGRYLLRAANDGITAVIGPHGEIVGRLPQFEPGVLRAQVYPRSGLTPYARFGNYPVLTGAALLLAAAFWRRRRGTSG
jgi:apolipoprotein N-acyltransferase